MTNPSRSGVEGPGGVGGVVVVRGGGLDRVEAGHGDRGDRRVRGAGDAHVGPALLDRCGRRTRPRRAPRCSPWRRSAPGRARRTAPPPPRRGCWARTPGAGAARPAGGPRPSAAPRSLTSDVVVLQPGGAADRGAQGDPDPPRVLRGEVETGVAYRLVAGDQGELDVAVAPGDLLLRPGRGPPGRSRTRRRSANGSPAGSKSVMPRVAVRPLASRSQNAGTPMPPGATMPMPVTATRLVMSGTRIVRPAAPRVGRLRRDRPPSASSVSTWPSGGRGASGPRWKTMRASTLPTLRKRWRTLGGIRSPWSGRSGCGSPSRSTSSCPQTTYTNSSEYGW